MLWKCVYHVSYRGKVDSYADDLKIQDLSCLENVNKNKHKRINKTISRTWVVCLSKKLTVQTWTEAQLNESTRVWPNDLGL